jgi:hypothetical protein
MNTASRAGHPYVCFEIDGRWCECPAPLIARDKIGVPSSASLRSLKGFTKHLAAAFLKRLIRLEALRSLPLGSAVGMGVFFWAFNHARRLIAFIQTQNTFAGIKPYWDVCNPITQTMRLLRAETTRPVHIFLPTRNVATMVRKQDR